MCPPITTRRKDAANIRKHGVSLSEADGVLNDRLALTLEDGTAEGEQRFGTGPIRKERERAIRH